MGGACVQHLFRAAGWYSFQHAFTGLGLLDRAGRTVHKFVVTVLHCSGASKWDGIGSCSSAVLEVLGQQRQLYATAMLHVADFVSLTSAVLFIRRVLASALSTLVDQALCALLIPAVNGIAVPHWLCSVVFCVFLHAAMHCQCFAADRCCFLR